MNQALQQTTKPLPQLGDLIHGCYFVDFINIDGVRHGFGILPKAEGEFEAPYGSYGVLLENASHLSDGLRNTEAMAAAGHEVAIKALANNCHIWSRDEMELCHRHLKPTTNENGCYFRDGENPNSIPPGQLYTPDSPTQTILDAFKEGGSEAIEATYHGCSTQYSADYVFVQDFSDGSQTNNLKATTRRGRLVRRFLID